MPQVGLFLILKQVSSNGTESVKIEHLVESI